MNDVSSFLFVAVSRNPWNQGNRILNPFTQVMAAGKVSSDNESSEMALLQGAASAGLDPDTIPPATEDLTRSLFGGTRACNEPSWNAPLPGGHESRSIRVDMNRKNGLGHLRELTLNNFLREFKGLLQRGKHVGQVF